MPDFDAFPADEVGIDDFKTSIGFTPSTWPVGTTLLLCKVPWDSDYRDVVYFHDATAQNAYFNSLSSSAKVTLQNATFCKPSEPVTIDLPYSAAYKYNYLRVTNPQQPVPGEATQPVLYYFIKSVSMIAPNSTRLYLQLDVWQTYQLTLTMGRCFVERGHVARHAFAYSSLEIAARRRRYLMTPEGLDLGASYIQVSEAAHKIGGDPGTNAKWWVVLVSAVDLTASFGTVNDPKLHTATGDIVDALPSGANVYAISSGDIKIFMDYLSDYPWIANQILSLTVMPRSAITQTSAATVGGVRLYTIAAQNISMNAELAAQHTVSGVVSPSASIGVLPKWTAQPKSQVYPFSFIKMWNYVSEPLTLMPEQFATNDLRFTRMESVLPPFQKIAIFPRDYGTYQDAQFTITATDPQGTGDSQGVPYGETFDNALIWNDFPQFNLVNDGYLNYLASNANTLKFQRSNAGWSLDKSLASANVSYDNANRSLAASAENQRAAYEQQKQISRYNMGNLVQNELMNTYNNMRPDWQQGINAFFGTSVDRIINTTVQAANGTLANELGNTQFQNTMQAQRGNIDANYQLQQWAAKGDYQQQIAGINASVRDARMLPPTQSGTMSGGFFANLMQWHMPCWYIGGYTVASGIQSRIADYWNRYGYAVCEYVNIGRYFLLNSYFTYWKCADTTITSMDGDEGAKEIIRGIFEKGVSIWGNANNIAADPDTTLDGNAPSDNYIATPIY